jgi:glucose-6-phosphate isomerase
MKDESLAMLRAHAARLRDTSILSLFDAEADRLSRMTASLPHLFLDASKHKMDRAALDALWAIAEETDALGYLHRMANGAPVNVTENRAALHTALRATAPDPAIAAEIATAETQLDTFTRDICAEIDAGRITGLIHIGIGGSDLGPRLVIDALAGDRRQGLDVRFAANIDGADIADATAGLDPARTLVVIVSKTFTTLETLCNAAVARDWLRAGLGRDDVSAHLAAVSASPRKAVDWGIAQARVFPFWDFVGGRYSVWSAVGISARIALRDGVFAQFKAGAAAMDAYALTTPLRQNGVALAALVQTYRRVGEGAHSYALIPYARRLRVLPAFLQQLEMESNGKRVSALGEALSTSAAAVTWGDVGANAQHSFFQLLHQGVDPIPVEFIVCAQTEGSGEQRAGLLGNALAQAEALLVGRSQNAARQQLIAAGVTENLAALSAQKAFPGNRGSTLIGLERLDAQTLGALIAFYEHRTVLQAALMGINPFDQWGVELGKELAGVIAAEIAGGPARPHDPSTTAWIKRLSWPS